MKRGFTLIEVLVVAGIFLVLSVAVYFALTRSATIWRTLSSQDAAAARNRRAVVRLLADVEQSAFSQLGVAPGPSNVPGGGFDGDAFWCLSAIDPVSGEFARLPSGEPFWQKQILYYLVAPTDLNAQAGFAISGGADADGYEDRCPYKVLIRKVIDTGTPTTPASDPDDIEVLLSDPSPYLSRPTGVDVSAMSGEVGLVSVEVISDKMLSFRAIPQAPEVLFELRSVAIEEARASVRLGAQPLTEGPFVRSTDCAVFPQN